MMKARGFLLACHSCHVSRPRYTSISYYDVMWCDDHPCKAKIQNELKGLRGNVTMWWRDLDNALINQNRSD